MPVEKETNIFFPNWKSALSPGTVTCSSAIRVGKEPWEETVSGGWPGEGATKAMCSGLPQGTEDGSYLATDLR